MVFSKVFIFVVIQACVTSAHFVNHLQKRIWEQEKEDHILVCKQEPLDIGIVLDSSSSIYYQDFDQGKEFLQKFVAQYEIGQGNEQVRVGIIPFGKGIYPENGFGLSDYDNKVSLLDAIGDIKHMYGLSTDTGDGIKFLRTELMNKARIRPFAAHIGIVLTDGDSQRGGYTKVEAEKARKNGIQMFAIGVGNVKQQELINIAGNESRVLYVENYGDLDQIMEKLAYKTCIKKEKPTTTPPKAQECGVVSPADINFVFSPASLGLDATAWATSFISRTIDADDMKEGFQYGLISGSCPEDEGFPLSRYSNVDDIRAHLDIYDRDRLPGLMGRLVSEGFTADNGAREGARKIAVLFVGGKMTPKDIQNQIAAANARQIQLFLASASGSAPNMPGAIALAGRSSREQSEDFVNRICENIINP